MRQCNDQLTLEAISRASAFPTVWMKVGFPIMLTTPFLVGEQVISFALTVDEPVKSCLVTVVMVLTVAEHPLAVDADDLLEF